jgi:uncharacterized protein CbrC (UPF0167 family)
MASEMVTTIADSRMRTGAISAAACNCDCCDRQLSYVDKWESGKHWHSGTFERGEVVAAFCICEGCEGAGFTPFIAAMIRSERVSPDYLAYVKEAFAPKVMTA